MLGGVIALDKSTLMMLISEPLIICPVAGAFLGEIEQGVMLGMIWQIIWMAELPIGASKTPDGSTGALVSTWIYLSLIKDFQASGHLLLTLCFIGGIAEAYAGGEFTIDKRQFHTRYMNIASKFASQVRPKGVESIFYVGLAEQFFSGAAFTGISYIIFYYLTKWVVAATPLFWNGLFGYMMTSLWGMLSAMLIINFFHRKTFPAIVMGLIVGVMIMIYL